MTKQRVHLAVDLGASGGRVVAGLWDGEQLQLEEVHRFPNGRVRMGARSYWDVLALWEHVRDGLRAAASRWGDAVSTIGVDSWGVDFVLLDQQGELVGIPFHYRDPQTNDVMERVFKDVSPEWIFELTGIQFLQFNTLYQWIGILWRNPRLFDQARSFLMIPDFFHWLLTGQLATEYTNATTTQFYHATAKRWAFELLYQLRLPSHVLGRVIEPGTCLSLVTCSVCEDTGLKQVHVVVPGTHDTASAVAAVPAARTGEARPSWCYISSGTWSLLGVELPAPIINGRSFELDFTNEGGVNDTIRLLKNITGLWLIQECRRIWKLQGKDYSWDELVDKARQVPAARSLINPDDHRFLAPDNMPEAIREYCRRTGQPVPDTEGQIIRCALDSLALRYRMVLEWTEQLIGGRLTTVHIVGGGVQNQLLCQLTADVCGRQVLAGPVEATSLGNIVVQAMYMSGFRNLAEAREAIRRSFPPQEYVPQQSIDWEEPYARFTKLCQQEEND